jgi:hypothetical protein
MEIEDMEELRSRSEAEGLEWARNERRRLYGTDAAPLELGDDGGRRAHSGADRAQLSGRDAWIHWLEHLMDDEPQTRLGSDVAQLDGRDAWVARLGGIFDEVESARRKQS